MNRTAFLSIPGAMAALVLALLTALCAAPLAAQSAQPAQPAQPTSAPSPVAGITVQGQGQVRADPDEATVRLGVLTQDATARAAQDKANQVSAALLDAVAKLGVPRQDVQT